MTDPTNDASTEAAPAAPAIEFVNATARTKTVPLAWPLVVDGTTWETISIRRVTGVEINAYVDAITAGDKVLYPGIVAPREVYEALDADDLATVDKAVSDFFPERFRAMFASTPDTSDRSSP